jgi:hypothetical protein
VIGLVMMFVQHANSQVENVPVSNQIYEFLDRMGVKGILPLYSNAMVPRSRKEVAQLLLQVEAQANVLSNAEREYLDKFKREFIHEIDPSHEDAAVLFRDGTQGMFSDKEKYLYAYTDSSVSAYVEFLGTMEHRRTSGDTYGSTSASFEQHGGRIRGTIKNTLGYYLQATNGTLFGDKIFALSDPRLRGNVKFKDLDSPYFDFTEAYLRADFDWMGIEFGREFTQIGTGYSDRLLLSDNAPVFDFLKLDAHYKSFRFTFLQASLVNDSSVFTGIPVTEPQGSTKYLALHRAQISLFDALNLGVSEMIIYQRYSPDFAYLNPINFYKSSEHSLRDRDNAFLSFDFELFPIHNYKLYGTWLIDDIDFSKIGTGWWGNEFGWQGGLFVSDFCGIPDVDAVVEYTRIEPYVYSNRLAGNDYSHNSVGLGHHLEPNSDEWFVQFSYRPISKLRGWLTYTGVRHGDNIVVNGVVVKNVGGNVLQGHRDIDGETAPFLDGNRTRRDGVQLRATYEPITNFLITGAYEFRRTQNVSLSQSIQDHLASLRLQVEY